MSLTQQQLISPKVLSSLASLEFDVREVVEGVIVL